MTFLRRASYVLATGLLTTAGLSAQQPVALPPVQLNTVPEPPALAPLPEVPGVAKGFSTNEPPPMVVAPTPIVDPQVAAPIVAPPIPAPQPTTTRPQAIPTVIPPHTGHIHRPATPLPTGERVASPAESDFTPVFKFKPGDEHLLQMETSNGLFKFFVGGRLQIDAVGLKAEDDVQRPPALGGLGDLKDATNFRRARFDFGGTFYKNIDFLMEFDFINTANAERTGDPLAVNTPAPTDVWVTFKELPYIGNLRIGNMKPPISFEHLTSSRFLNFLERSLAFDAFVENQNNGFEFGAMAFNTALDDRLTWAAGLFKNTRNVFGWNTGDGEYDITGRVTCLPVWENDGEYLVHLGLGVNHRDLDDDQERLRARLMLRNGPAVLHTIVTEVRAFGDSRSMVVPEFVAVAGPWTFAAEYYKTWLTEARTPTTGGPITSHGTAHFRGGYMEVLYFLTGEHRAYNRKTGAFGRVTPRNNFTGFGIGKPGDECEGCSGGGAGGYGTGAWQVGLRCQFIDLDDAGIRGGKAQDVTLGLNWFLNPYLKVQWNYTALHRDAPVDAASGWVHGFGTRIAFDF
jgi:phosphate-selective porin OprO/OprP